MSQKSHSLNDTPNYIGAAQKPWQGGMRLRRLNHRQTIEDDPGQSETVPDQAQQHGLPFLQHQVGPLQHPLQRKLPEDLDVEVQSG